MTRSIINRRPQQVLMMQSIINRRPQRVSEVLSTIADGQCRRHSRDIVIRKRIISSMSKINVPEFHRPTTVIFSEESTFQIAFATVTLSSKSTYKVNIKLR